MVDVLHLTQLLCCGQLVDGVPGLLELVQIALKARPDQTGFPDVSLAETVSHFLTAHVKRFSPETASQFPFVASEIDINHGTALVRRRVSDEVVDLLMGNVGEVGVEKVVLVGVLFFREIQLVDLVQVLIDDFNRSQLEVDLLVENHRGGFQQLLDGFLDALDFVLVRSDELLRLFVHLFVAFLLEDLHQLPLMFLRVLELDLLLNALELLLYFASDH